MIATVHAHYSKQACSFMHGLPYVLVSLLYPTACTIVWDEGHDRL